MSDVSVSVTSFFSVFFFCGSHLLGMHLVTTVPIPYLLPAPFVYAVFLCMWAKYKQGDTALLYEHINCMSRTKGVIMSKSWACFFSSREILHKPLSSKEP